MFTPIGGNPPRPPSKPSAFDGGGGSFDAKPAAAKSGVDSLQSTIVSQLLGVVGDNGTHTTGHPGYTVSHAADRDAARGRFGGYQANAKKATQAAVNAVMGRNKGIKSDYTAAGKAALANAASRDSQLQKDVLARQTNYAKAAAAMGLSAVPDVGNGRAAQAADAERSRLDQIAGAWSGFDRTRGLSAVERNSYQGDAFRYAGQQQQTTLDQLLEKVIASMPDQVVASTLGTAANTSQAQKSAALKQLQYSENAINAKTLAGQKLLAGLTGSTSTTTNYGSNGGLLGSSTTVRK